jgi:hypothetical protein
MNLTAKEEDSSNSIVSIGPSPKHVNSVAYGTANLTNMYTNQGSPSRVPSLQFLHRLLFLHSQPICSVLAVSLLSMAGSMFVEVGSVEGAVAQHGGEAPSGFKLLLQWWPWLGSWLCPHRRWGQC